MGFFAIEFLLVKHEPDICFVILFDCFARRIEGIPAALLIDILQTLLKVDLTNSYRTVFNIVV